MELPPGAIAEIRRKVLIEGYDGGGFSNVFSRHNTRIKRLGRVLNLRLRDNDHAGNTVFFGNNGIFVRRRVFDALGGFLLTRLQWIVIGALYRLGCPPHLLTRLYRDVR